MDDIKPFPRPRTAWALFLFLAVVGHAAVYAGGLVRPEPLARVAAATHAVGYGAFDFWAALLLPFSDPLAVFAVTVVWSLAGAVIAYAAAARLVGHFAASALAGAAFIAGYPGWHAALPSAWAFWVLPVGAAGLVVSLPAARRLARWRAMPARWTKRRSVKAAWIVLLVFAVFVVAEQARLGLRGAPKGKFPYPTNGLTRGFDRDLSELRLVQHAGFFREAVGSMHRVHLLHDNRLACLAAHGAAARFLCRVGRARPDIAPAARAPQLVSAGWVIEQTGRGLEVEPGSGGFRYTRLHGTVDGAALPNWYALRERVLAKRPRRVTVEGPVFKRGCGKNLRIEVEVESARRVTAVATLDGKPLPLVRRDLAAGDRVVVLFAARLPSPLPRSPAPLAIEVEAPTGILDFDVYLETLTGGATQPPPRGGTPLL